MTTFIKNNFSLKNPHSSIFKSLNKDVEKFYENDAIHKKIPVTYVPPTRSLSRYKDHRKVLDKGIFSKDSEKILKTFDVSSREEISRVREADRIRHSADMQVIMLRSLYKSQFYSYRVWFDEFLSILFKVSTQFVKSTRKKVFLSIRSTS